MGVEYQTVVGWFFIAKMPVTTIVDDESSVRCAKHPLAHKVENNALFCSTCGSAVKKEPETRECVRDFCDLVDSLENNRKRRDDYKFLSQFSPWSSEASGCDEGDEILIWKDYADHDCEQPCMFDIDIKQVCKDKPSTAVFERLKKLGSYRKLKLKFGVINLIY